MYSSHVGPQGVQGSQVWTCRGSGFVDVDPKGLRVRRFGPQGAQGSKISDSGFEDLDSKWLRVRLSGPVNRVFWSHWLG